jgi:outer membrane lipoprotein-sorting protein
MRQFSVQRILAVLVFVTAGIAEATTLEAVKARYMSVTTIDAKISLTKQSKYLKRPVVSDVLLKVSPGLITWETTAPVHSTIQIDKNGLVMDGARMDAAVQEKTKALVNTLKSLLTFDWPSIEAALDVSVDGLLLRGKPKAAGALAMFSEIDFEFLDNLEPKVITLTADRESTIIQFKTFKTGVRP